MRFILSEKFKVFNGLLNGHEFHPCFFPVVCSFFPFFLLKLGCTLFDKKGVFCVFLSFDDWTWRCFLIQNHLFLRGIHPLCSLPVCLHPSSCSSLCVFLSFFSFLCANFSAKSSSFFFFVCEKRHLKEFFLFLFSLSFLHVSFFLCSSHPCTPFITHL